MSNFDNIFKKLNQPDDFPDINQQWDVISPKLERKKNRFGLLIWLFPILMMSWYGASNWEIPEKESLNSTESQQEPTENIEGNFTTQIINSDPDLDDVVFKEEIGELTNEPKVLVKRMKSERLGTKKTISENEDVSEERVLLYSDKLNEKEFEDCVVCEEDSKKKNNMTVDDDNREELNLPKIKKLRGKLSKDRDKLLMSITEIEPIDDRIGKKRFGLAVYLPVRLISNVPYEFDISRSLGISASVFVGERYSFFLQGFKSKVSSLYTNDFDNYNLEHLGAETYYGTLTEVGADYQELRLQVGLYRDLMTWKKLNLKGKVSIGIIKPETINYIYTYSTVYSQETILNNISSKSFYFSGTNIGMGFEYPLYRNFYVGVEGEYGFFMNENEISQPNTMGLLLYLNYQF